MGKRKPWMVVFGIALVVMGVHLLVRWMLGEVYVGAYADDPSVTQPIALEILPFPCSLVSLYGQGIDEWQTGNYEEAAGYFQTVYETLGDHDESGNACDARVNYALSLVTPLEIDDIVADTDSERKKTRIGEAIDILVTARQALVEGGCAADDGTQHDADAEQLKEDIDRALERLYAAQTVSDDSTDSSGAGDDTSDDDTGESKDEKTDASTDDDIGLDEQELEETLHERRTDSDESDADELGGTWNFNISNRPW